MTRRRRPKPDTDLDPYLDEELQEIWEERAAIMEYDGGYPRALAEHHALRRVRELKDGESQLSLYLSTKEDDD